MIEVSADRVDCLVWLRSRTFHAGRNYNQSHDSGATQFLPEPAYLINA
jgi:hypothetical protein